MAASKAQPKYHASQIAVNEPQAHTRVFLFHLLFERKKKNSQKRKQNERPILTALTQRLNSEIYLCSSLKHQQFLSLWNDPEGELWSNNKGITSKKILGLVISFHTNPKFSSLHQCQASSRVFQNQSRLDSEKLLIPN